MKVGKQIILLVVVLLLAVAASVLLIWLGSRASEPDAPEDVPVDDMPF